ncbi:MAG TPA: sigma-70 family RNA polymerase sigma factor [Gemmataceae bacterium]|nr:sigma-70 family RNA polymerase sigma factor [Gemmataceae bacterium]
MEQSPATRASLLVRLRDPHDKQAWEQFVQLYAPVVYGFARKRGLQDADAADLMQEVFRSVAGAAGRLDYDPKRGSFRGWLYTITRNKIYTFLDSQRRQVRGSGDSGAQDLLEGQAGRDDESGELWDREYERGAFAWAAERVRGEFHDSTWRAFWLTAVEGQGAREVGRQLGLSPGAVYVAKSRVISRLREEIRELEVEQ